MRAATLLVLLLLLPALARGQVGATTDLLRGRVVDQDGAPVPGASVEAWSLLSGIRRAAVTDADGRYTLVFPDGGGRYRLRVSYAGAAPAELRLEREGDEEVLTRDVRLELRPVDVEGITARGGRLPPPGRGDAGSTSRGMSGELTRRLPLDDTDPASLAALTPGVVSTAGADSLSRLGGFSVAGQRASQNQVTLDGATFASMLSGGAMGGSLGLPQEGLRSTQVVTNTYDVSRGQFSGGQVAMTTQGGTSTHQGSFSYQMRDDALQGGVGRTAWSNGYAQHRVSGGMGGPIARDRMFYNLSLTAQRRTDENLALTPRSALGYAALGAHPDSVARFLEILQRRYGASTTGQTGAYDMVGNSVSALGRLDFHPGERHALSLRAFASGFGLDQAFVRPLELRENSGEIASGGRGAVASLTSRLATSWVNELRASLTRQFNELTPLSFLPEGRVLNASERSGGGRGVASLGFGGDPFPPRASDERTLELSDELSWLVGSHRLRVGALFNATRFEQEAAFGRNGTFTFHSLADLEAGRASSFTRSLLERATRGSGWNAALYLGDTWRAGPALQLVYGVRLEGSGYGENPAYLAAVDSVFGRRTDHAPSETRVSPRLGFSWRAAGGTVRGGVGEFRGRAPYALYAGALGAARGDGGASILSCVGEGRVPAPDFTRFRADRSAIPSSCADGSTGRAATGGLPDLTVFEPDFAAPRSWRASLGYQRRVGLALTAAVDATYARGVAQYGVRDLNLAAAPAFTLPAEGGRPVWAPAAAIDPRSGAVPLQASRRDPRFAHVYGVHSELESESRSLTMSLGGTLPRWGASFQAGYTLGSSRDQSSFTFGGAAEGFARSENRGDPNRPEWAASDFDHRHSMSLLLGLPLSPSLQLSLVGRAASGSPFTPRVAADVNGDGSANDAAFVFDPDATADPALASAMRRVLESAEEGAAGCLRRQLGRVAGRNSCRGGWSHALDLRLAYAPGVGALGRRVSFALDAFNLAAGLDLALHGSDGARGWGQGGGFVDGTLLYPRGFDPATRAYRYQVNESFGRNLSRVLGRGSPFALQLSARVAVGPGRGDEPMGGFGGLGMGEGGGTRIMVSAPAGAGPLPGGPPAGGEPRVVRAPAGAGPGFMLARMIPTPVDSILALRDSLSLSEAELRRITEIRDTLAARNDPIRQEVGAALRSGMEDPVGEPARVFERIGPRLNQGRKNVQDALDQVRALLGEERWNRVPERLRNAVATGAVRVRGS